jgi:hypothetical protein
MRHTLLALIILAASATGAAAQSLSVDEFRRELVGVPLCATPAVGQLAGKTVCTVHMPDGTAILAGSGIPVVRGVWEAVEGKICRRNAQDSTDQRRCVTYERITSQSYRNSDGIELCLGPCEKADATAATPRNN